MGYTCTATFTWALIFPLLYTHELVQTENRCHRRWGAGVEWPIVRCGLRLSKNVAKRSRFDTFFAKKIGRGMVESSTSSGLTRSFPASLVGGESGLTGVGGLAGVSGGSSLLLLETGVMVPRVLVARVLTGLTVLVGLTLLTVVALEIWSVIMGGLTLF